MEAEGPPCRRCRYTTWKVEPLRKGRIRHLLELMVAAPDVILFGNESAGWPQRETELWICQGCGRRVGR